MVRIRKATLADIPVLAWLEEGYARDQRRLVIRKNSRLRPYMQRRPEKAGEIAKWLRKCIRSSNVMVLLTEIEGSAVGMSVSSIQTSPPIRRLRHYGSIDLLYVVAAHRGQRISSLMMEAILVWFKRRGVRHLSLQVIDDNPTARAIYRKWGFFDFFVEMRRPL